MKSIGRKLFTLAIIASYLLGSAGYSEGYALPDLGDESASIISPAQEQQLGEEFMRSARRQLNIPDDPELNTYIQSLGQRLTRQASSAGQNFHLFLVQDPSINAFAVPGGFIGIHTGLILATENEAELASVLAHETAHITQRHIPRMMAEAKRTSGPAMAALLAAILLAGSGHQGGEAAIAMTTAGLVQKQLNYTREFEQEADRVGMNILTGAGYDARAMPAFFEQMQTYNRLYETNLPEFLRTHPITTRRIAESRDHAEKFPQTANPDATDFYHAQAKIRVLSAASPAEAVASFRGYIDNARSANRDADHYGYTLALLSNKQFPEARNEINQLLARHSEYPLYWIAQAEIEMAAGKYPEALKLYAARAKKAPGHPALTRRHAAALLKTNHAAEAHELLKKAVRAQPDEPALQQMLATAAGNNGALREAHQAMAEYYYLNGNPDAAIQQLQIARRHAGENFYYISSLDARIKEIRDKVKLYKGK